jgi:hypothetical protein
MGDEAAPKGLQEEIRNLQASLQEYTMDDVLEKSNAVNKLFGCWSLHDADPAPILLWSLQLRRQVEALNQQLSHAARSHPAASAPVNGPAAREKVHTTAKAPCRVPLCS